MLRPSAVAGRRRGPHRRLPAGRASASRARRKPGPGHREGPDIRRRGLRGRSGLRRRQRHRIGQLRPQIRTKQRQRPESLRRGPGRWNFGRSAGRRLVRRRTGRWKNRWGTGRIRNPTDGGTGGKPGRRTGQRPGGRGIRGDAGSGGRVEPERQRTRSGSVRNIRRGRIGSSGDSRRGRRRPDHPLGGQHGRGRRNAVESGHDAAHGRDDIAQDGPTAPGPAAEPARERPAPAPTSTRNTAGLELCRPLVGGPRHRKILRTP